LYVAVKLGPEVPYNPYELCSAMIESRTVMFNEPLPSYA